MSGTQAEWDDFTLNQDYRLTTTAQVGGDHYTKLKIQPITYIRANRIGFVEGNIIKYVTRYKDKNGIEDLKKARHFLDMLIEELEVAKL